MRVLIVCTVLAVGAICYALIASWAQISTLIGGGQ